MMPRSFTVLDSIRMARFVQSMDAPVVHFSPDRSKFVVVTRVGNLEENSNEYSILLFDVDKIDSAPQPRRLLTLSTSSNGPAISSLEWLADSRTVVFLAEWPERKSSICALDVETQHVRQIVENTAGVAAFDVSPDLAKVVFISREAGPPLVDEDERRHGVVITSQSLLDLVRRAGTKENFGPARLFVKTASSVARRVELTDAISAFPGLSLSPDGRYALIRIYPIEVPDHWREYDDPLLQVFIRAKRPRGAPLRLYCYVVVDTETGLARRLLDAPSPWGMSFAWSPDSASVVLGSTFLPLIVGDRSERAARQKGCFIAEIGVESGVVTSIAVGDARVPGALRLAGWDRVTNSVLLRGPINGDPAASERTIAYRKMNHVWRIVDDFESKQTEQDFFEVDVEEDLNTPPRVVATDCATGVKTVVFDPNPQFRDLTLAQVEEISWTTADGRQVKGGLYWPPGYVEGNRYPLVIQTHGWRRTAFMPDGMWTTGFAAQALAAKGIIVVQAADAVDSRTLTTPEEGSLAVASFEALVDSLDERRLIDRARVGLMGFSRTCYHVKCALTRSEYSFAAAAITDGIDAGYFQYMAVANSENMVGAEYEKMNGGLPFGPGLRSWMDSAPGFHLDKVRAPLRIEAIGLPDVISEWEWFAGLSRLGKPVEFLLIPHGAHILEKPWERMISQQGNVDWFCFWLKGEEDDDPAKREQYARWRELRGASENKATLQN
jgi:hypothetical protein